MLLTRLRKNCAVAIVLLVFTLTTVLFVSAQTTHYCQFNMTQLRYTRRNLYQLKKGNGYPESSVIEILKLMHIFHVRSNKRGRNVGRNISVVSATDKTGRSVTTKPYKHIEIPRIWYHLPSVLLSNVTSLSNKVDEVTTILNSTSPGIFAITEAWQVIPETIKITNYDFFHHLRTERRGGGVALFCRSELRPSSLTVDVPEGVEALWIRVTPPSHPRHVASIICCVVYHPPRSHNRDQLLQHLIDTSDLLKIRYPCSKLLICGDFNEINTTDLQAHLQLTQVVNFPTHDNNILDLILTDMADHYQPPVPMSPFGRSNHCSIFWPPTPTFAHQQRSNKITYRPLTDSAIRQFGQWIVRYPWIEVTTVEDVNTKWENYLTTSKQAFLHFFPEKSVQTHPSDAPWMTSRIKRIIQQRNRAFSAGDIPLYRSLRNRVIREITTSKKSYYPNKLQHLKHTNISQWFSRLQELCGLKNRPSTFPCVNNLSSSDAAEAINNHFATICQQLPKLNHDLLPAYLPAPAPAPIVFEYEVANRLQHLKLKRSSTPVDLPIRLYKEFSTELAKPLTSIINASFQQSKCPTCWKSSYITPIPKSTNPQTLNHLRPIAITPIPSLICESFAAEWTYSDISDQIDLHQYGNVRSSSTTHYLTSFLDFIHQNLDKRNTSVTALLIDFTKAFDLVDHTTIIIKAQQLGLRECLISWLADFLNNRQQAVRFQGTTSKFQALTCGVPQGTRMGPLCFLILINNALQDTQLCWKYVDDSTVATPIDNTSPDYSTLQSNLDTLLTWTRENHITINQDKTVIIHFNLASKPTPPPTLKIGDHTLGVVQSTKLLGITLNNKLHWDPHINSMITASSFRLHMLRTLKKLGVTIQDMIHLYNSFILPKLCYASPVWSSSLTLAQRAKLERVQKRALRIILGPTYTSYQEAINQVNLPTVSDLHKQQLQQFARKLVNNPRHRHMLPPEAPPPARAVRHHNRIVPIRARTDRYKNSTIPAIVKLLNA